MWIEIGQMITMISVAISLFFNSKSAKRTDTKDIEARAASITKMEMNIEQMTKNLGKLVDDLYSTKEQLVEHKSDTKEQLADHNLRITIVENGLKNTAKEVNGIVEKQDKLEDRVAKLEG